MHKILSDKTFEMKFHFINKQDGSSASELALKALNSVFAKYGHVRLYKGIIIFTSSRTFLDASTREQEGLEFAGNLEKEIQLAASEVGEFELLSLD